MAIKEKERDRTVPLLMNGPALLQFLNLQNIDFTACGGRKDHHFFFGTVICAADDEPLRHLHGIDLTTGNCLLRRVSAGCQLTPCEPFRNGTICSETICLFNIPGTIITAPVQCYLDKFFDLRTTLPKVDYDKYINRRFDFEGSHYIYDTVCVEVVKYFNFSLRESERYIRLVKIAGQQSAHNFSGGFPEHRAVQFSVLYVVPIIIGLQMADMQDYMDFVEGKDARHMLEILQSPNIRLRTDYLMLPNESYNEVERTFEKTGSSVKLEDRLLAVYDALFSKLYDNRYHENDVGAMSFSMDTRKNIDEIVALISRFADYKFE